nr:nitroreductase family protein [Bacteroidota bacterium]
MTFKDLITKRESIRNYDAERKVDQASLTRILEAGWVAPSAANRQPWKFYLVSTKENLDKVRTCYDRAWFHEAPHVLIVAGKRKEAWERKYDGYNALETDLTIAMDHMILAAESEGVSTCWIAAFDPEKLIRTGILDDHEEVFAITPLGYPKQGFAKKGLKARKPFYEVVRFV